MDVHQVQLLIGVTAVLIVLIIFIACVVAVVRAHDARIAERKRTNI